MINYNLIQDILQDLLDVYDDSSKKKLGKKEAETAKKETFFFKQESKTICLSAIFLWPCMQHYL